MYRSDFRPGSHRPIAAASSVLYRKEIRTVMAIVAHTLPFVIGVDTHSRNHSVAILAASTGEHIDTKQFPTTPSKRYLARRIYRTLEALHHPTAMA